MTIRMRRFSGRASRRLWAHSQRLAVDVLLEQALAHHQPEIAPRMPPRLVRGLVDDVADVVDAAGIGRAAGFEPGLAALAALPGAGGEAEDLDLDAAALQRAGEDVAADRRDGDRAAAHRAGIVEQQRHHGVAEIGIALDLEAQRLQRIGDDAGQARGVEQALLEIELPAARSAAPSGGAAACWRAARRRRRGSRAACRAGRGAGRVLRAGRVRPP
jgi:hypothetical protein